MTVLRSAPPADNTRAGRGRPRPRTVRACVIHSCGGRGTERRAFRMGTGWVIGVVCSSHVLGAARLG